MALQVWGVWPGRVPPDTVKVMDDPVPLDTPLHDDTNRELIRIPSIDDENPTRWTAAVLDVVRSRSVCWLCGTGRCNPTR